MSETATLNHPVTARIVAFLQEIGIRVETASLAEDTLLPAMTVRDGGLVFDPERLEWPGDLLHEAGHIAVTDPVLRPTLSEVPVNPAEEMAAIAWSYAAAVAIKLDPAIVFHDHGYRGGGNYLAENFAAGRYIGVPMLQWLGLAVEKRHAEERGVAAYPEMQRWLR